MQRQHRFLPLATLLAAAISLNALSVTSGSDAEELLIGWKGETWSSSTGTAVQNTQEALDKRPWVETIAWKPRAFIFHNFLTEAECDHLTSIGNQRVQRSMVVDSKTGASKTDDIRTSYGAAFGRGEDPIIAEVEQRIAEWTHLPPENGEPIQVLRYMDGQKYDAHWDWFDDPTAHAQYLRDGNRYATVLMYLGEVEEGGETALPLAEPIDPEAQRLPHPSPCAAKMGISVLPRKGDALLFFDMDIAGSKGDRAALHASCPTLKGTKWTATKWIHNKRYSNGYDALSKAMLCEDALPNCAVHVKGGACDTLLNLTGPGGLCRRSCQDCVDCPKGDILCGRRNMRGIRRRKGRG